MKKEEMIEVIKKVRETAKKRNFKQSFDMCLNFKMLDTKKPENKIKTDVTLPHGTGKPAVVGIIADTLIPKVNELKDENVILIKKNEIEALGKKKKDAKKLANKCKVFLAEAPLMPAVAKALGPILAPRGKMPKPIPPTIPNLKPLIAANSKVIKIAVKDSPVAHCIVGSEELDDQKIADNLEAIINGVTAALPRGKDNIRNVVLKMTMTKGIKFKVK